MFAGVYFGEMYFAGEQGAPITPPAPTPTRRTLIVPCAVKECLYDTDDLTSYNLDDAIEFNGVPLSRIMVCPTGYYCPPGLFPKTVVYPPGTFSVPIPPINTGFPIFLNYHGCQHDINTILPANSTEAAVHAAAQQLIQEAASQQAICDAINLSGPPLPIPVSLTAIAAETCVDSGFSATIYASSSPSRSPYTFSVSPQPSWMVLTQSPTQLFISGTPTTIGPVSFTVTAAGVGASGSKAYTLNVVGIATTSPLGSGNVGDAYAQSLDASTITGTLTWSISSGSLPDGLSLDPDSGEITGTPTTEESSSFTVEVSNGTTTCRKDFALEITDDAYCGINETSPLPSGTTGVAYSHYINADDVPGLPPFAWTVTSGALPAGLTMNDTTWELEGTPTLAGHYAFTLKLTTDSDECSKAFEMDVEDFDCEGNPSAIQDLVWSNISNNPGCSTVTFAGGLGTFSLTMTDVGACNVASAPTIFIEANLCNPGAPYLMTVTIPFASTGGIVDPPPPPSGTRAGFNLIINSVSVDSGYADLLTDLPNPFVLTGMVENGINNIRIGISFDCVPAPSVTIASTADTTITPLTPP